MIRAKYIGRIESLQGRSALVHPALGTHSVFAQFDFPEGFDECDERQCRAEPYCFGWHLLDKSEFQANLIEVFRIENSEEAL